MSDFDRFEKQIQGPKSLVIPIFETNNANYDELLQISWKTNHLAALRSRRARFCHFPSVAAEKSFYLE